MKTINRSVIALAVILSVAIAAPARAAKEKAPPSPAAPAIAALLAEYQAAKDKKSDGLRTKCDFFATEKPSDVTPEVIIAALEKPISPDLRAEAYVKWQLLSGIDGKIPEQLKARALQAYRIAPAPPKNPGLDHAFLDKSLMRIGTKDVNNETPINKELAPVLETYQESIIPFMAYRDEFYSRFTPGYDTFQAGFYDIYGRVSNGANATEMWKGLGAAIRTWALSSSEGNQMRNISTDLAQLKKLVTDEKFRPYYRVMFLKEGKDPGSLKWQSEGVIGDLKLMTEIGEWLGERAKGVPPGSSSVNAPPADPKPRGGRSY